MNQSIESYLEAPDGAGRIVAHARLLLKLSRIYQQIAPAHLAEASTLANYKSGSIVIHATSGAVAAKLRQMAPTLADGFRRQGVECSDLQVKVQAHKTIQPSTSSTIKPLTPAASRALEGLRDTLPQTPLRSALDTLLRRSARTR